MTAMESAYDAASAIECEIIRSERALSPIIVRMSSMAALSVSLSREDVTSSAIRREGDAARAIASSARWHMPPES